MCSRCPPRREIACVQHATGCHPCMTLDGTLSRRPCSDGEAAGVKMTPPLVGTRGLRGLRGGLFFFHHPAPAEIYTLSLHDALPISSAPVHRLHAVERDVPHDLGHLVGVERERDRKSTRLNSSHGYIAYAVFCL